MYYPRTLTLLALLLFVVSSTAYADFIGLDADGDLDCDPAEMAILATGGDIGSTHSLGLFFDDLPPILGYGCTFCVADKNMINNFAWSYDSPGGWTDLPIADTEDPNFPQIVSPWITETYPNYRCWFVQAIDFSLMIPITTFPVAMGNLSFDVAEEGCIGFIIDGPNSAYLDSQVATTTFTDPNDVCGPFECDEPTSTRGTSWGSVKTLFR